MEHQEIKESEKSYVCYPLSRIDEYDEKYEYKNGDIIRVNGDMYKISGLNRGDFIGKLIKKNGFTIKEQIISVFDSKKRKDIDKKKEKIKEMVKLTKKLRQNYTNRRQKRTETINEIEKIWPRSEYIRELKEKLKQLDNEFLRNINEYCKKDDIDSLKGLENYEQFNKEYNEIIKDLEKKLKELKEKQNKQKREAEEARRREETRRKAEEAKKAEEARRKENQKQDSKGLFRKLAIKYHPDRTGKEIIYKILGRDLTDPEKEQLKNELDNLQQLNNKIFQEINKNKDKPEFLKNYVEPKEYKDAIENLETKLNEIKSNEGQLNSFQSN